MGVKTLQNSDDRSVSMRYFLGEMNLQNIVEKESKQERSCADLCTLLKSNELLLIEVGLLVSK